MGWNGADLVSDFSAELGDTSTNFKAKVLRWINDGLRDIATSHQWPFLREKGKVILTAGQELHSIVLAAPAAPSASATAGGSLTDGSSYRVLVTFIEGQSGVESKAGESSAAVTVSGANLTLSLSSIPVSTSTLVTARKIYLSKDGGEFKLSQTIANNTATTATIAADSTSAFRAPDYNAIFMIDGDFYIEDDRVLDGYTIQRLRFETNGTITSGTPSVWAPVNEEEIIVYPKPSAATTLSFFYFKLPMPVFDSSESVPQMPAWMYDDLYNYVIWRGYAYRDRAGKESKQINYKDGLRLTISRKGMPVKRSGRVRSVTGDSDGYAT